MNILKKVIFSIFIMFFWWSCCGQTKEKVFLNQFEFEEFLQFKDIDVSKRGGNNYQQTLALFISYSVNNKSKTGCYLVTLDKKNYQVLKTKWTTEYFVEADTTKLQQLEQEFIKYNIPLLRVDTLGNVFIYLKDAETLAMVKFTNESERLKRSKETKWIKIQGEWYKAKR